MAVALRFIGLLLLITLGACVKTEIHRGATATAPPPKSSAGEYTVRPGDTLYSIAKHYGIDYHLLAKRNHLNYPYTIYNGQKLQLRESLPSSQVAWVYKVRPGDTLYSIARRLGLDYHLLARRNRLSYPYTIYVGQELHLAGTAPMPGNLPGVRDVATASPPQVTSSRSSANRSAVKAPPVSTTSGKVPGFTWPLRGTITSGFGSRGGRMHDGIDIGAKEGTPITAAADGEVVYSDHRLSGYGNLIILRHSGNVFTAYAHNQRNLVRKGERVKRGDTIARVGQTGRASGPHLHFEVRRGSTPVDPLAYLPRR